jgi:hypothetical protein
MNVSDNGGSKPNYYPNSFEDLPRPDAAQPDVHPYKYEHVISDSQHQFSSTGVYCIVYLFTGD